MSLKIKKILIFVLAVAVGLAAVVGLVLAAQSYRITYNTTSRVEEFSKARNVNVSASCPSDLFVPTNTSGEYDTFIANKPACVNLTTLPVCPATFTTDRICNGTQLGSSGSYAGCDSFCETLAGATCCYATVFYYEAGGTSEGCTGTSGSLVVKNAEYYPGVGTNVWYGSTCTNN